MALSRIRCCGDLPTVLSRFNHPVNSSSPEPHRIRQGSEIVKSAKSNAKAGLHVSGIRRYPDAPRLPLPNNVSEIFGNETGRFTPERARDIAAPVLYYASAQAGQQVPMKRADFSENRANWGPSRASCADNHVDSYDCFGAVSLNSSMQSNVPSPYCSSGKASHFNMPGGQWAKDSKYIAEDMQKSHYTSRKTREFEKKRSSNGPLTNAVLARLMPMRDEFRVEFSTDSKTGDKATEGISTASRSSDNDAPVVLTNAEKLKKAVKDYGSTVIVFHIGISLISLGACYVAVSSGLDVGYLVRTISYGASERIENVMANSSTFLVAYAVHKLLAPIRISITLGATPFVVRYLRNVGILKMPKA